MEQSPAIGARLREARLRQGLEIADCASATRIRERYLVAIEDGRYESLPDPAYINGFVRAYATHLGVTVQGPIRELPADHELAHGSSRSRPVKLNTTRTTPRQAGVRGPRRWPVVLLALIIVAVIVLVVSGNLPGL